MQKGWRRAVLLMRSSLLAFFFLPFLLFPLPLFLPFLGFPLPLFLPFFFFCLFFCFAGTGAGTGAGADVGLQGWKASVLKRRAKGELSGHAPPPPPPRR